MRNRVFIALGEIFFRTPLPVSRMIWRKKHRPTAQRNLHSQILIDLSIIRSHDARTGIQRTVRALWLQFANAPPPGYVIRPVYAQADRGYCYLGQFLGQETGARDGETVQVKPGDVFLALDLAAHWIPRHAYQVAAWKRQGARIHFLVYDLLPLIRPDWFTARNAHNFLRWIKLVAALADGGACISNAVKIDLENWLSQRLGLTKDLPKISTIPLGGNLAKSEPTRGLTAAEEANLNALENKPFLLMVGTIEPRKGHEAALNAVEALWRTGQSMILVIAGRPGWSTDALQERLKLHPEYGKHLFWFDSASDECLDLLYKKAAGLLAASYAEGYGLPIVEAAEYGKPVLARDIPVFREIGGEGLRYFTDDKSLATSLEAWFQDLLSGSVAPPSAAMVDWEDSYRALLRAMDLPLPAAKPTAL